MLEMAQVGKEDIVYDLGCGDGRIVAVAAGEFGARAVGIEADPVRFLISFLRVKLGRTKNRAKIIWGNFYSCSLSEATVVTVFLSPEANERLKEKLQRELSPGTRIVSYLWVFEGWKAIKADYLSHLYLYRI
ncbi:SAM-dependent methyltransferase [Candidatus Aerophobetes bacterium]|nr:SAM-dependent methyltransferase [Candidatus Aerophobetes bacterium]